MTSLDDYFRVDDLANYDQLTRALGFFIHRHGRIGRLDSLNEHWLETEARLRTDFNIPGINKNTIGAIKRKSLMKSRFLGAGLAAARGKVCKTPAQLKRFIAEVGLPVVAKPDVGVGAAKTYKLESNEELERYLADKPAVDYIVEEFVRGELITYDGLAGRAGEILFDSTFTLLIRSHGSGQPEPRSLVLDRALHPGRRPGSRPGDGPRLRPARAAVPFRDLPDS